MAEDKKEYNLISAFFSKVANSISSDIKDQLETNLSTFQEIKGTLKGYDELGHGSEKPVFKKDWYKNEELTKEELIPLLTVQNNKPNMA